MKKKKKSGSRGKKVSKSKNNFKNRNIIIGVTVLVVVFLLLVNFTGYSEEEGLSSALDPYEFKSLLWKFGGGEDINNDEEGFVCESIFKNLHMSCGKYNYDLGASKKCKINPLGEVECALANCNRAEFGVTPTNYYYGADALCDLGDSNLGQCDGEGSCVDTYGCKSGEDYSMDVGYCYPTGTNPWDAYCSEDIDDDGILDFEGSACGEYDGEENCIGGSCIDQCKDMADAGSSCGEPGMVCDQYGLICDFPGNIACSDDSKCTNTFYPKCNGGVCSPCNDGSDCNHLGLSYCKEIVGNNKCVECVTDGDADEVVGQDCQTLYGDSYSCCLDAACLYSQNYCLSNGNDGNPVYCTDNSDCVVVVDKPECDLNLNECYGCKFIDNDPLNAGFNSNCPGYGTGNVCWDFENDCVECMGIYNNPFNGGHNDACNGNPDGNVCASANCFECSNNYNDGFNGGHNDACNGNPDGNVCNSFFSCRTCNRDFNDPLNAGHNDACNGNPDGNVCRTVFDVCTECDPDYNDENTGYNPKCVGNANGPFCGGFYTCTT